MKNDSILQQINNVHAEFRMLTTGHVPAGCVNGWFLQPFTIFILTLHGYGETIYRNKKLGIIPRPESSVAFVRSYEARRSVTKSPDGLDYVVVGFSFAYHGGADFLNQFQIRTVLPEKIQNQMRSLIQELAASEKSDAPDWRKMIVRKKCGYGLLDLLISCSEQNSSPDNDWKRLQSAIAYLNQNYRKKFNIDELLRQSPYSRVHFYRIFRQRFHMAPQEYMISLRLREATKLLLDSDLNVAEIGMRVGWENPFYFSKIFKTVIGISPLHYRKNPGEINGDFHTSPDNVRLSPRLDNCHVRE